MYGLTKLAWWYKEARSLDAQNRRIYESMLQTNAGINTAELEALIRSSRGERLDIPSEQEIENAMSNRRLNDLEERLRVVAQQNPNIDATALEERLNRLRFNIRSSKYQGFGDSFKPSLPLRWPELHHGTSADAVANILEKGLDPSKAKRGLYGEGIYFTTPEEANLYHRDVANIAMQDESGKIQRVKINTANLSQNGKFIRPKNDTEALIYAADEASRRLRRNPREQIPGVHYTPGASVRFATPTENRGSGLRYPKTFRAINFRQTHPEEIAKKNMSRAEIERINATRDFQGHGQRGLPAPGAAVTNMMHVYGNKVISPKLFRPVGEIAGVHYPKNQSEPATTQQIRELANSSQKPNFFRSMTNKLQGFTNKLKGFRSMKG